jgi:hypothetical protein
MGGEFVDAQDSWKEREPALRATFAAFTLEDSLENGRSAFATTRSKSRAVHAGGGTATSTGRKPPGAAPSSTSNDTAPLAVPLAAPSVEPAAEPLEKPDEGDKLDALEPTAEYWGAVNPPSNFHLAMEEDFRANWVEAYKGDSEFGKIWADPQVMEGLWSPGQRFFRNSEGLLFFRDADYQPRLCVPNAKRSLVKEEAHESPLGSAHISPERLWNKLSSKFYWRRMKKDLDEFCDSCDVCQKIKTRNFTRYGFLIPNPIPHRPYESISLDLIVNLPWSGEFNAILVVVDRLTKHASFIPTTSGLTAQGFADLFVEHALLDLVSQITS